MNHVDNNIPCPVCGYDGLEDGTASGEICSSCGTEFGYSDFQRSYEELRRRWISEDHAKWWSRYTPTPHDWSPVSQLRNVGYVCTNADLAKISLPEPTWFIAWTGIRAVGATPAYVSYVVSTHNDIVALVTPVTKVRSMNQAASNLVSSSGLLVCLNS